ncbi:IS5 family transposase [Sinomonas sp. RB5]
MARTAITVPRLGPGRARSRPEAVLADKAYSSKANRSNLRGRGIKAVIAEPKDQKVDRRRKGFRAAAGPGLRRQGLQGPGRPRAVSLFMQWRGIATRYDKLAQTYRP